MDIQIESIPDSVLVREYKRRFIKKKGARLQSARDASEHARAFLANLPQDQEHMCCIYCDTQNRIIKTELVSSGGLSQAAVFPRVIIKRMIELEAGSLIAFHSHPSGLVDASSSDKALTKKLAAALNSIDCQLLDHLIIGESYMSFCDEGLL